MYIADVLFAERTTNMLLELQKDGRTKIIHVDAPDTAAATPIIDYERVKKADGAYLLGDGNPRRFDGAQFKTYEYMGIDPQPDVWV